MFSRKEQETEGKFIPSEWQNDVQKLLEATFEKQLQSNPYFFDTYGKIYQDELLLIVSLTPENAAAAAVSCFVSVDNPTEKTVKKFLDSMLNFAGDFFETYFQSSDWSDYSPRWLEVDYQGNNLFYKVTRENLSLTLKAEELLKGNGEH